MPAGDVNPVWALLRWRIRLHRPLGAIRELIDAWEHERDISSVRGGGR